MKLVSLSINIFHDVLEKQIPFALSIRRQLDKEKLALDDKKKVSSLVGCALRHLYLFDYLFNQNFSDLTNQQRYYLYTYLASHLYLKSPHDEEIEKAVLNLFKETRENFKKSDFIAFKEKIETGLDLNDVEDINTILSIRYNIPTWVIKIWNRNFKKEKTEGILKFFSRPQIPYCQLSKGINKEEFLKENKDFKNSQFDDFVIYQDKHIPIKSKDCYINHLIYKIHPSYKLVYNEADVDLLRGAAIYGGSSITPLLIELLIHNSNNMDLEVVLANSETYFETKKLCKNLGLNRVSLYEAKASSLITIFDKKLHTLFVCPRNTRFELLRTTPDYFLRINQDSLDEILKEQEEALDNASSFIEDGGSLVYLLPTLNDKESRHQIANFLNKHQDFVLIKQKQFFPFDKYDSSLFFTILKKENKND